jgi:hypothetical protein
LIIIYKLLILRIFSYLKSQRELDLSIHDVGGESHLFAREDYLSVLLFPEERFSQPDGYGEPFKLDWEFIPIGVSPPYPLCNT